MPSDQAPTRPLQTRGDPGTRPMPVPRHDVPPVPVPVPAAPSGPTPSRARDSAAVRLAPRVAAGAVAVAAAALAWAIWRFFVDTYAGQMAERAAFDGAVNGQGPLWAVAEPVLDTVSVTLVVVGLGAAMGIALLRRRWGLAVQVAFLVVGANVTTQVVKHQLLGRENLIGGWTADNSLPSGHTTVAASVAAAVLLVVPRGARPLVAVLGAVYTAATGVSTLVGQWHRPSDVVAAVLVVLAWGALVCAFTPRSSLDRGVGGSPGAVVTGGLLLLVGAGATAAALWAYRATPATWSTTTTQEATAYLGGVAGVGAATAAVFAVLLLVRQSTARPGPRRGRG